jgi:hypothetical protein
MLEGVKEIERLRAALTSLLFAVESGRYSHIALRSLVRQVSRVALHVDEDPWLDAALDDLRARVEATRELAGPLPLALASPLEPECTPEPAQRSEQRQAQPRYRRLHTPRRER